MKKFIKRIMDSMAFPIILLTVALLLIILSQIINLNLATTIPDNVTLDYRTVEPSNSGFLFSSGAQYFIFDTSGHRYPVSRDVFDSYKDLPRQ